MGEARGGGGNCASASKACRSIALAPSHKCRQCHIAEAKAHHQLLQPNAPCLAKGGGAATRVSYLVDTTNSVRKWLQIVASAMWVEQCRNPDIQFQSAWKHLRSGSCICRTMCLLRHKSGLTSSKRKLTKATWKQNMQNAHETFAHLNTKVNSDNFRHCFAAWNFNSLNLENRLFDKTENITGLEVTSRVALTSNAGKDSETWCAHVGKAALNLHPINV